MSQTTGTQLTFEEDEAIYLDFVGSIGQSFQIFGLLGGLYGVLTVLSVLSFYALIQRKTRRTQPASIILCLVILTLFISTTTYLVTMAMGLQYSIATFIPDFSGDPDSAVQSSSWREANGYTGIQHCAGTAALTFNITLGDAIVCWRASVVWQNKPVVRAVCGAFLLATFVLGVIDTTSNACLIDWSSPIPVISIGSMYQGVPIGVSVCVLSLSTNLFATLLVGYKAWYSVMEGKRNLKGYLVSGSQVEKLLALLIESGGAYCALWGTIVAFQIIDYYNYGNFSSIPTSKSAAEAAFMTVLSGFLDGGLVPLVAIYPTIIIVLVANNRSQLERGLLQNLDSLPDPNLAVTVNTVATSRGTSHSILELSVIGSDGQGPGSGDDEESCEHAYS